MYYKTIIGNTILFKLLLRGYNDKSKTTAIFSPWLIEAFSLPPPKCGIHQVLSVLLQQPLEKDYTGKILH